MLLRVVSECSTLGPNSKVTIVRLPAEGVDVDVWPGDTSCRLSHLLEEATVLISGNRVFWLLSAQADLGTIVAGNTHSFNAGRLLYEVLGSRTLVAHL